VGLSDNVVQCMLQKVRDAHFVAPGPKGSTLTLPITFAQTPK